MDKGVEAWLGNFNKTCIYIIEYYKKIKILFLILMSSDMLYQLKDWAYIIWKKDVL